MKSSQLSSVEFSCSSASIVPEPIRSLSVSGVGEHIDRGVSVSSFATPPSQLTITNRSRSDLFDQHGSNLKWDSLHIIEESLRIRR